MKKFIETIADWYAYKGGRRLLFRIVLIALQICILITFAGGIIATIVLTIVLKNVFIALIGIIATAIATFIFALIFALLLGEFRYFDRIDPTGNVARPIKKLSRSEQRKAKRELEAQKIKLYVKQEKPTKQKKSKKKDTLEEVALQNIIGGSIYKVGDKVKTKYIMFSAEGEVPIGTIGEMKEIMDHSAKIIVTTKNGHQVEIETKYPYIEKA